MNTKFLIVPILLMLTLAACDRSDSGPVASDEPAPSGARDEHAGSEHGEENTVRLTPAQIKSAGIEIAEAGPASIRETLPLYGVIAPNAENVRDVTARYPGVLRSVSKRVGDTVRRGDVLATVESDESLEVYHIVAPLDGVVVARDANPGEQTRERQLFTVADLSTVWVELALFPGDVDKVSVGQRVRVKGAATKLVGDGEVVYVAPFGSSASQTLSARVLLDNHERRWAPGIFVTAELTLAETQVALAIHTSALQNLDGREVIFVLDEDGFEPRPVTLGRSDGEFSELLAGLQAGAQYASSNSFIIKAELGKDSAEHAD